MKPQALLTWCVSQGFGSVLFKESTVLHIVLSFLYFQRKQTKCSSTLWEALVYGFSIKHFFVVCITHHLVLWLTSVALTNNAPKKTPILKSRIFNNLNLHLFVRYGVAFFPVKLIVIHLKIA